MTTGSPAASRPPGCGGCTAFAAPRIALSTSARLPTGHSGRRRASLPVRPPLDDRPARRERRNDARRPLHRPRSRDDRPDHPRPQSRATRIPAPGVAPRRPSDGLVENLRNQQKPGPGPPGGLAGSSSRPRGPRGMGVMNARPDLEERRYRPPRGPQDRRIRQSRCPSRRRRPGHTPDRGRRTRGPRLDPSRGPKPRSARPQTYR